MDKNARRKYFVQYVHDEDPDITRTFYVETTTPSRAKVLVGDYISSNNLHPYENVGYVLIARKLKEEDKVEIVLT